MTFFRNEHIELLEWFKNSDRKKKCFLHSSIISRLQESLSFAFIKTTFGDKYELVIFVFKPENIIESAMSFFKNIQ